MNGAHPHDGQLIPLTTIEAARRRLAGRVARTPQVLSPSLSQQAGKPVYLKLENHQYTGSFKLRGATNAVLCLAPEQRERGVVAASTGNHGNGLAFAARRAGARAVICMSRLVPRNKVENIEGNGAEVRIIGASQDEAQEEVRRLADEDGLTPVPPFDHPDVIAGQGTIGLEILEDLTDAEGAGGPAPTVVVPLSGGGLIAGIARAVKARRPDARVVGVTQERGAAMIESVRAGRPVLVEEQESLADSLGGGIGLDNRYTFRMVRDLVDDLVLVGEEEIADAIRCAYWKDRQVVEGAGAVGIAALRTGRVGGRGPVVLVLSGANIDMAMHHRLVSDDAWKEAA